MEDGRSGRKERRKEREGATGVKAWSTVGELFMEKDKTQPTAIKFLIKYIIRFTRSLSDRPTLTIYLPFSNKPDLLIT